MPRFHILSDLHLEFGPFARPETDADLTILAGDIYTKGRCSIWQSAREFFGRPVVMVPGNHEFYGCNIETTVAKLKSAAGRKAITVLEEEELTFSGVRILGCTLWSDFKFFAGDDLAGVKRDASHCVGTRDGIGLNDFRSIRVAREGYRRFRPMDAALLHHHAVEWLRRRLAVPFSGPTVVVTHHAPSARCVPVDWLRDKMTCAYASRLDWLVEEFQPALWVWGHIHESVPEFRIGQTWMLSNPRGYAPNHLNPRFRPDLVVSL